MNHDVTHDVTVGVSATELAKLIEQASRISEMKRKVEMMEHEIAVIKLENKSIRDSLVRKGWIR